MPVFKFVKYLEEKIKYIFDAKPNWFFVMILNLDQAFYERFGGEYNSQTIQDLLKA